MVYAFNDIQPDAKCVIVFQDVSWPVRDLKRARSLAKDVGAFGIWKPKRAKPQT